MKKIKFSVLVFSAVFLLLILISAGNLTNERKNEVLHSKSVVTQIHPKEFVNCIFNDAYESWNHQAWILNFLDRYKDSLHFNTLQYYNYPEVSNYYGSFNSLMNPSQIAHNIDLLNNVGAIGLETFTARQNIEKYCYGQRLVYEVSPGGSTTENDGFCYQIVMSNTYTPDSGRTVLHAQPIPSNGNNSPGYLCKGIYENLQHTDQYDFVQLDGGEWFLKPEMRIPQNIFSASNTTPVIAVAVVNYEGDVIDSIVVRVNNFRDGNNDYDGNYINNFTFLSPNTDSLKTSGSPTSGLGAGRDDDFRLWKSNCKVDFRIWWFGEVEVWFDKMTVDDERANDLFNPSGQFTSPVLLIQQEAEKLGSHPSNFSFFVDEVSYPNYPCINYVDSILKTENPDARLHTAFTNYFQIRGFKDNEIGQKVYFKNTDLNSFNADAHVIDMFTKLPNNFLNYDSRVPPSSICTDYNDYNEQLQFAVFGDRNSITPENTNLSYYTPPWWGSLVYQVNLSRKNRDLYTPNTQFIMQPQIHSNAFKKNSDAYFQFGNREPTNQEIQAQAMISIAHGAEGLCWFLYPSVKSVYNSGVSRIYQQGISGPQTINTSDTTFVYNYGLTELLQDDPTLPPRYSNLYGQDKWNYVKAMNIKLEHWKPSLDKILFDSGYSLHSEGTSHKYISDIKSLFREIESPYNYSSSNDDQVKYWEMGFFEPDYTNPETSTNDKSKYFIMVNRRCFPEMNHDGDLRKLKIQFSSTQLAEFKNWKIIDLDSNKIVRTFDKDSNVYIDMGFFQPGEGKLYKLAPVMQEGGTLVADEDVIGNFDCKGEVNNNGKNITLKPGTTINFTNSDARIIMNGGNFKSGINTGDNTAPVNLQGKDTVWKGIVLQDCPSVEMYKTYFKDISPYEMDSTYAVDLVNCLYSKIDGCSFLADEDLNTGGISANFTSISEYPIDAYFLNSTFQMCNENIPALSFISSGGITVPLIIDGNTFISDEGNSANAIFLCNVSGGAIKNNTITDYKTGVFMLSSAMDFYNNVIDGSSDNSIGIKGASQNNLGLGTSGNYYTAGLNTVSSEGSTGKCVYVYKSSLDLHKGENIFDLKNYNSNDSYHLSGTFSYYLPNTTLSAVQNCFRVSGVNNSEIQNVKWINGNLINFDFLDYSCEVGYESEKLIVDLGNDIKDTIYYKSGGNGGGKRDLEFGISDLGFEKKKRNELVEIVSAESLLDSININTRRRNYNRVISDCQDYLSNHMNDSSNTGDQSSGIISKLFLASSRLDVSGNKITDLKTLLENLILNNPQNESLIKSAFYYIQKCKVKLGNYESAMTGFQQIMDQNPYSYEALTASWDYAATFLLLQIHSGSGGGISNYKFQSAYGGSSNELRDSDIGNDEFKNSHFANSQSQILYDDPKEKYDKNVFTKEDRKEIKTNVFKSFETGRDKEIEIVKTLEKKVSEGNAKESEKKELEMKKILKDIAKPKKPANTLEHVNNVSGDINKITDAGKGSLESKNVNVIPEVFYLSQNYPNPFNPSTKISFDLPVDAKVKLTVYDMLGREVKSIVNTQLTTGRYEYKFSATGGGSNFSSGIYFYRIEAVDNSGKKFVQTKRMVLVK